MLTRSSRVSLFFFVRWPVLDTITYTVIFKQLSDVDYKPLDPSMLRLPAPQPPSERLLAAVEAFYSPPSHERPRNRLVWEWLEFSVVSNFVIGWNNLAPIFQPIRERPRFHGQVAPYQVCPVWKGALVNHFGPKSDQHQLSPNNITRSTRVKAIRITKLITKGRMLWS